MKPIDTSPLAAQIAHDPAFTCLAIERLRTDKGRGKFAYSKAIIKVSEESPQSFYPFFDEFVELLRHENAIIQWTAIRVIANLAAVDAEHKIDRVIDRYLKPIAGPVMITAANTIAGAARIALVRPDLADKVITAILRVEQARYQTDECRNIAVGHAITALASLGEDAMTRQDVVEFVKRQTANTRNATRNKAAKFLRSPRRLRRSAQII